MGGGGALASQNKVLPPPTGGLNVRKTFGMWWGGKGETRGVRGGVYSIFMHGRSRMTIDPRTPTMPGLRCRMSGFSPTRFTSREAS